jgi:NADPH2:quinone reductase
MATKPMKQAIVHPDLSVEIVSTAIPVPTTSQVLIKVEIAGSNPKDWYLT